MAFIKKMVMNGFKSFGKKTEILFDKGINVILGPNGSGKSNVSDALCFVLGRLSIKSMRASQAKNLIFMGSKYVKPAHEASVELIFDNSDRAFSVEKEEIVLKRIVRRNGQSIYKINDETKTRTEIIELLAQAGIDPHGFNLVLQGQIQSIVRMHPEERRKIIEDVAGISIYESRKEKSLHELEKTEEKLKEINTILRERTAYLRNLEEDRKKAMRFKELELTVKRCKASIVHKKNDEKNKEIDSITKSIQEKEGHKDKKKTITFEKQQQIEKLTQQINQINKNIQQSSGVEQEGLRNQIANLRAELEGLRVRKENYENKKSEIERRIEEIKKSMPELQSEIENLRKESPVIARKANELKKKKEELAVIEEERKSMLTVKTELNSIRERIKDKEKQLGRAIGESESVLRQIEEHSTKLSYKDENECLQIIEEVKKKIIATKEKINELNKTELEDEKISSIAESEILRNEEIKRDVSKIDTCPLCQSKITEEHIKHVIGDSNLKIEKAKENIDRSKKNLSEMRSLRQKMLEEVRSLDEKKYLTEVELVKHRTIHDRKESLKRLVAEEKILRADVNALEERRKNLENKGSDLTKIEEAYNNKILEIEEISSSTVEDSDTKLLYKERDVERLKEIIKNGQRDFEDVSTYIKDVSSSIREKEILLESKDKQEKALNERFKKMFEERDSLQEEIQEQNLELNEVQSEARQIEEQINYLKIGMAKLDAEKEALTMEMSEYGEVELIQASLNALEERMKKSQEDLIKIGSINMRALEVYDEVKKEYDIVQEKVNTLESEKQGIMLIVEEIDKKKKSAFMKTFRAMNELFTNNFAKLYTKGVAYLEIENKEDIFAGGVNIVVKLAKGKYFDVTSLSGGEQTLVALSLLFAIQEHKPYHFYVFDEIDAALDKRNSERLAGLLNQYMKTGQYIVVTHNDAIIMNSNILYGVSMHDGISKILSLKVNGS